MEIYSKQHNFQIVRARELKFGENIHPPTCVTFHVSHVMCHVSCVTCHMSRVTCHVSLFLLLFTSSFFFFFFFLFFSEWWSYSVECLLSTRPTRLVFFKDEIKFVLLKKSKKVPSWKSIQAILYQNTGRSLDTAGKSWIENGNEASALTDASKFSQKNCSPDQRISCRIFLFYMRVLKYNL